MKKAFFLLLALFAISASNAEAAGIPTFDASAVIQETIAAQEAVAQTLKQIEEYRTQLLQYERQLMDAASPAIWLWGEANNTMNSLLSTIDQLNYYRQQVGSIDNYLAQFKNIADYKTDWFNGLNSDLRQDIIDVYHLSNASQKQANDALIKSLDARQQNLYRDAQNLERLQSMAQGATGQMQAIQYANQLASHQSNQLLEIRAALIAQQNVLATQAQEATTIRAQQQAAHERLSEGAPARTPNPRTWP